MLPFVSDMHLRNKEDSPHFQWSGLEVGAEFSKWSAYDEVSNLLDATTFSFINLLNQPYMFRATDSPILRSTYDCIHSFRYNATLQRIRATDEMELT